MNDDRFEEFLKDAAAEYRTPPVPPREEMWARIQAARAAPAPASRPAWPWWVGIAAMIALAFGLGRMSGPAAAPDTPGLADAAVDQDHVVYRMAATDYLERTDAFLTLFRMEARASRVDSSVAAWAQDLLATARLMLDSPAAEDPALRHLLQDLELVLVEITGYVETQNDLELELIEHGLEEGAVQLRLQATLVRDQETLAATGAQS